MPIAMLLVTAAAVADARAAGSELDAVLPWSAATDAIAPLVEPGLASTSRSGRIDRAALLAEFRPLGRLGLPAGNLASTAGTPRRAGRASPAVARPASPPASKASLAIIAAALAGLCRKTALRGRARAARIDHRRR